MLKAFFTLEEPDKEMPDATGIEWLDAAIALALYLARITTKESNQDWQSQAECGYLENSKT